MRSWLTLGFGISVALAVASEPVCLTEGIQSLQRTSSMALILNGEETVNGSTRTFANNTYFITSPSMPIRLESWTYEAGKLKTLGVADGTNLFHYVAAPNQYEVLEYKRETNQVDTVLQRMLAIAKGPAQPPLQLLNDLYRTQKRTGWQSWLPTASGVEKGDQLSRSVHYRQGSMTYLFIVERPDVNSPFVLTSIEGSQGSGARRLWWVLEVHPNLVPAATTFKFAPPTGAKVVSGTLSQKTRQN